MTAEITPTDDLAVGSFSSLNPPWVVAPDTMPWRLGIDQRRAATGEQVARWTRRRVFPGWRSVRIVAAISAAVVPWALRERRRGGDAAIAALASRLRRACEKLGPPYIKFAQLISSGQGLLPQPLVDEFTMCQDRVPAMSFDTVRRVVERDLGGSLDDFFADIEHVPLAAASIAQVHVARLRDGTEVVIKVQREGIVEQIKKDIRVMAWVARVLPRVVRRARLVNPSSFVELFAETISEELDFRLEAQNMLDIAAVLAATDQRQIVCPRPHPSLVTARVLVMERMHGYRIDDRDGIAEAGIVTTAMLRGLFSSFFEGAVIFGVFHGDLHAGNAIVTLEGRAALLDFGITARLAEPARLALMRLLMSSLTDDARVQFEALRDLGAFRPDTDIEALMADLGIGDSERAPGAPSTEAMVANLRAIVPKLLAHGARLPKALMLFIKGFIYIDGTITTLASELSIAEELGHLNDYLFKTHGDAFMEVMGIDYRELDIDPTAQMARMAGVDVPPGEVTFGQMRELQAEQQADMRQLMRRRGRRQRP